MFHDVKISEEWMSAIDFPDNCKVELREWEHHYGLRLLLFNILIICPEMRFITIGNDQEKLVTSWNLDVTHMINSHIDSYESYDKFIKIFEVLIYIWNYVLYNLKVSAPVIHLVSVLPGIEIIQDLVENQELAWKESGYSQGYQHNDGSLATSEFITNGHKYHNWYNFARKIHDGMKYFVNCVINKFLQIKNPYLKLILLYQFPTCCVCFHNWQHSI